MNALLIFLGHTLELIGGIALLLLSVTLTGEEWRPYPWLMELNNHRVLLFAITAIAASLRWIVNLAKDVPPALEAVNTPNGQVVKATLSGFEKELDDAANERKKKAQEYFEAGERDYENEQYAQAVSNYKASFELLPTMAASLNTGIVLHMLSNYSKAEDIWKAGLDISQNKKDKNYEASLLGNIGLIFMESNEQENVYKAIPYFHKALEIYQSIKNIKGQATCFTNIGHTYKEVNNYSEALNCYQKAFLLHKKLKNQYGQAMLYNNIGLIYEQQNNLNDALNYYEKAYDILKPLDRSKDIEVIQKNIQRIKRMQS